MITYNGKGLDTRLGVSTVSNPSQRYVMLACARYQRLEATKASKVGSGNKARYKFEEHKKAS